MLSDPFRRLTCAAVLTRFADTGHTAVFALLAARLTDDPRLVSAVAACSFLPWVLFGLVSGALVDRHSRRRLFLTADLVRAVLAFALATLLFTGHLSLAAVFIGAFAMTALQTVSDSCLNSLVPALVRADGLGRANARLSMAQNGIGRLAGAPATTALLAWKGPSAFLFTGAAFLCSAHLVRRLPDSEPERRAEPLRRDLHAGLAWIKGTPVVAAFVTTVGMTNFASGMSTGVLPVLALYELGMSPAAYGFLAAAGAAAMIEGNYLAGRLLERMGAGTLAVLSVAVKVGGFALYAFAASVSAALIAAAILGFTAGVWNVASMTVLMRLIPDELRGRILAAYKTVATALFPLGALLAGWIAHALGVRWAFAAAGVLVIAAALHLRVRSSRGPGRA
ncbi:MFS transporter [Salininema proteolyticum]|uniref:MFS transporter n=1 Tax=Salininema proteolyticum TaxID=1607685 RepID=A0ABV8U5T6_9ACTN